MVLCGVLSIHFSPIDHALATHLHYERFSEDKITEDSTTDRATVRFFFFLMQVNNAVLYYLDHSHSVEICDEAQKSS